LSIADSLGIIIPTMPSAGQQPESLNIQLLVDSIPALIHTARPDGYLDYFNKPWLDYLGATLDDVTGWNWTAFVHPEDVEGILAKWRACLATGEIFEYETRVRRASGEYRWMFHQKVPLRDPTGNIVKWYGSSLDIEERKTAEEQLHRNAEEMQRSEFYLAEGQRLAHMGSWAFDLDGFDYWSPELFRMHGLDPACKPPSVQEYLDRVHPHDRESMANLIKGALANAAPFDATKRIVRPNGEVRYIRCVGVPLVENQSLKKYVGSAIDVTDHELMAEELRRREAYLTEAQRLSHTGSFGWKPDTGEIVWSDETYRIFEYQCTEKPTLDLALERIHSEDRFRAQEIIERQSETGTDFEDEYRLLMPGGTIKRIHVRAHAVHDSSGNTEFIGAVTDITVRRTGEEKIREQEAQLRQIIDAIPTLAWCNLPDGPNEFLNKRWHDYTGLSPEESHGWGWRVAFHPEDLPALMNKWREMLISGEPGEIEARLRRFDGVHRWFLISAEPLRDEAGRIVRWYGTSTDIEDRKRAEESVRRSEAYLAEAQRLSHTGSWAWSPDTDVRHWSEECYRVLGFDPRDGAPRMEELIQRIHPGDQPAFRESARKAKYSKLDEEVDYRVVHPDGAVRDIHSIGHPVFNPSGDLIEYTGTVIDVTEHKRAEEELRRSEVELRQMLDLAPQHVAVYGPNRERLYANRVTLDYLGLSLEEWQQSLGRDKYFHPDDHGRIDGFFDRAVARASADELELRVRKQDGSYRWFLVRLNPVRDEKGQITRWYVASTDIEDRKRAEERLQHENVALREEIDKASMFEEIVGTSKPLKAVLSRIAKVAPTDSTVLVVGETGTGKELIARAVHKRSQRSGGAFVSVNCAAVPRDLIASELFGHEKGAFTGAIQRRLGRFELADGGTIFLDEVGELLPDTQVALLRVLQEREFERVGGGRPIRVDVRVIAATNRDLRATIASGTFRQDLFYRLNVFPIDVPPLRERKDDILMLVEYFVQRYATKSGKNIRSIDKKTLDLLQSYDWPGNIRELQNVIERSVILSPGEVFSVDELWLSKETSRPASQVHALAAFKGESERRSERDIIEAALAESRGRVSGPNGAAAKLGIPPSTLDHRIKALRIDIKQFKFR
jgi:formate hydrogenlyase transcriptional activator